MHIGNSRVGRRLVESLVNELADLVILDQQFTEECFWCEPAAFVRFCDSDAEAEWMCFLSHGVYSLAISGRPLTHEGGRCVYELDENGRDLFLESA